MQLRVLLVEDEAIVRMMVADMVEQLGHEVAAEASDLLRARQLAETGEFDFAILDINLKGEWSAPVAEILKARRIPVIFATGYAVDKLPDPYRNAPALLKPFPIEKLSDAIKAAVHPR